MQRDSLKGGATKMLLFSQNIARIYNMICIPFRGDMRSQFRGKGKKVHKFHFRLEIYLHYYFHATWALLEDFENFAHFDEIFNTFYTVLFRTFRPIKVGMTPLGRKFELPIQVFDA